VHRLSDRREGPFVQVNCAAIPDELIESELFGHEKGAFTDAKERQMGKFALANGGVLFLDEIGDLSPRAQAKMLRALEQGEVEALGAAKPVPVDVKVVAATNQDLEAFIEAGRFRSDLFYRLNALPIRVPPLREHPQDIPALVEHFTAFFCWENALPVKKWEARTLEALKTRPWPGNVRELKNFAERLLIFAPGDAIGLADLPPEMARPPAPDAAEAVARGLALSAFLGEAERAFLLFHLRLNGGNIKRTAEALGIPRSHLYRSLQKLQIPKEEYRED
jgi:two-component system nitrogen regulation response regulator NtrX